MRTIEMDATVTADGKLTLEVPVDIPPGIHRVVLMIAEQASARETREPLNFPVDHYGPWPENLSLSRKDLYGDQGR